MKIHQLQSLLDDAKVRQSRIDCIGASDDMQVWIMGPEGTIFRAAVVGTVRIVLASENPFAEGHTT